jgi:iron complex outermembrane recepter protein
MGNPLYRSAPAALLLFALAVSAQDNPPAGAADDTPVADAGESIPTVTVPELRPQEPLPAESPQGGPQQIDEVTVTAQKTRQSARRVPVSVTAVGGERIQEIGAANLAEVSLYVPNVRVDADDLGSPQVFIRGFGTNAFNPSFESSVAFVQDEIYFGRPGYFTEAMFDIDRVEVLRGPQGTLFGKNTVAGVFNVISKSPGMDFDADGRYYHGDPGEQRAEGGMGGMLTDWLGARAAGLWRQRDGQLYNQFLDRNEDEQEQRAGRLKLRFFPGHGLDSEITAVVSDTQAPFWPFQLKNLDADTRRYLEDFDADIEDDPYDFRTSFDTRGWIEKGSDTVGWKTEWNAGGVWGLQDVTPVLVVGASNFHIDQLNELDVSPADIARLDNHEDHRQKSLELRVSGRADSLFGLGSGVEFLAGGFWYDSQYTLLARVLAGQDLGSYIQTCDFQILAGLAADSSECVEPGFGLPLDPISGPLADGDFYQFDYQQDIESLAAFGQFTWYLGERVAVTPGLRYSREEKRVDARGQSHCALKDAGLAQPCIMEQLLSSQDYDHRNLRRQESDLSPKLALQWFGERINYYASYARGYKSGGFNSISFGQVCEDPENPLTCRAVTGEELEYEPENARTWELGAKARVFEGTLAFNLTLYQTRFENLQVLAFNGVFFDVSNAADAESRGLEADFLWLTPWAPLRIAGSYGALDARYLSYPSAPAPISEGVNQLQDLSGRRIAFAPRHTGTLTPTLAFPIGSTLLSLSADWIFQGDQFTDTDLDPNTYVPAYMQYGARLTLADSAGRWALALGGTNLDDTRVLNQVTDATFFPGTFFAQQASGRQAFATLSLRL